MRLVTCTRYNAKCSACFPRLRLRQDNAWGTSFASAVGSRLVGWSAAKPFSSRSCRASAGTAATATPHAAPVAPLRRWRLPRRRCGGSGLRPNASIEFDEPRGPARGRCFRGGVGRTRRDSATPSPRELRSRRCAGSEPGSDLYSNTGTCTCHVHVHAHVHVFPSDGVRHLPSLLLSVCLPRTPVCLSSKLSVRLSEVC